MVHNNINQAQSKISVKTKVKLSPLLPWKRRKVSYMLPLKLRSTINDITMVTMETVT